jgi:tetratricopeptide (TPR) repeat protein
LAINKRKILQSAQKHMQKGALDKALKDYGTLLEADPRDVNIRLKVGDIHLKQGKTDEAVDSYLKVAQRFMKDGFDSKAIALYKQVTKIDPKRYDVYLPLSELYQRLGLNSDAMKALQTAADAHYRDGNKDQALDLLRKMATFDPSNTTNRLKVAELLRQEGREAEALDEYDEVVEELDRQGDPEERIKVLQKILDLDPGRTVTFVALGSALVGQQKWSQAEATAEAMIDAFPGEPEGHELLAEVLRQSGREDDLPGVYRRLAEVYKDRGDEDHAREIMQRFVSTEALVAEENGDAILEVDDQLPTDAAIGGDGTLAMEPDQCTDPGFLSGDGLRLEDRLDSLGEQDPATEADPNEATAATLPPLPRLETEPTSDEDVPEPEGDPEQLFAEASVYLRYGKHERAIGSLRAVLSQDPGHRAALEKLGEALVATGDAANAVTAFSRAAEAARAEQDDAGFESLRAEVEALDPAAAESLSPAPAPSQGESEPADQASPEITQHLEDIDIEIDSGVEAGAADESLDAEDSIEFEIEDDFALNDAPDADEPAAEDSPRGEEPTLDSEEIECDLGDGEPPFESGEDEGDEEEIDVPDSGDTDGAAPEALLEDTVARGGLPPSESGGSATTPQQMIEDLEEADFYFQQALYDEAEEIYRRILDAAPSHPQAMLRMGEIEATRSEPAHAPLEPEAEPAVEPDVEVAPGETPPDAPVSELPVTELEAAALEPTPSTADEQESREDDLGIDLPDSSPVPGFEDIAELDLDAPEEEADAAEPATRGTPSVQAEETMPLVGESTAPMDADAGEAAGSGDFDLAAELSGALDGEDTGPLSSGMGGTTEEEGFEQVFAAFKQGVQQELGDGDFEAHYDLGIAYKEMGLLDDAIGEFQIALGAPSRKLASLHAMGLCALDLERVSDAVSHLEQALALPEVPTEQQTALHFDLGRAYQEQGDLARARTAYEVVAAVDPKFGAVGERIAELESSGGFDQLADQPETETFESFDDLIKGAGPEPDSESYESFDDLLSEEGDDEDEPSEEFEPPPAEPELAAAEAEAEPALEPEPAAAEAEAEPVLEAELAAAESEAEPAPEPEPAAAESEAEPAPEPEQEPERAPDAPARKKPARRKKISFV